MRKIIPAIVAAFALLFVSGCSSWSTEYHEREEVQAEKKEAALTSLDKKNLERRAKIEDNPSQVGYVYLFLMGAERPMGYYVIEGKVSSSGGQLTPEQDVVRVPTGDRVVVDGPFDDGTYGEREPGIFFFTTEGVYAHTSLDYLYTTEPLPIDVPRFTVEG